MSWPHLRYRGSSPLVSESEFRGEQNEKSWILNPVSLLVELREAVNNKAFRFYGKPSPIKGGCIATVGS